MACNFNIDFQDPVATVVANGKAKIVDAGGIFNGDTSSGSFSVPLLGSHIDGSYTIAGQEMAVVITHKPFLVSCNQIEDYLKKAIA